MTNTLGILNNYPWTRLLVRIIGAIKRQFFRMVTHVFDNSNFSKEIFAVDIWGDVIYFSDKHMLLRSFDYMETRLNPIEAGVFWNQIGWGGHVVPPLSVSPLFVIQSLPNLAW